MNVKEFAGKLELETLCLPKPDAVITGGYTGDLLSWVMGNAFSGALWITIMTNINVVAVAVLREIPAILIAEGAEIEEAVIKKAAEEGINILRSKKNAFQLCCEAEKILEQK